MPAPEFRLGYEQSHGRVRLSKRALVAGRSDVPVPARTIEELGRGGHKARDSTAPPHRVLISPMRLCPRVWATERV
ncbi:hypothetical protein MTBUT4_170016 [Magnetospirillum sp. UT-4]|nr:hypothetical protein MTBUT4_170016 [Magnetospirillum sp. UT-4]